MSDREKVRARVDALRAHLQGEGVHATIIPTADPHQSEYVPLCWRRREWISGFTGSAGTAVVTTEKAGLWADSRYWIQGETELDPETYELFRMGKPDVLSPTRWLGEELGPGQVVGVDPRVLSLAAAKDLESVAERSGFEVRWLETNPIDAVWDDQPELPAKPLTIHPEEVAGRSVSDKLAELRAELAKERASATVVTALDQIAWLFNIRGSDVDYNPVAVSFAVVEHDRATLYVDRRKLASPGGSEPRAELEAHRRGAFECLPYDALGETLDRLGAAGARVWIEPDSVSQWVKDRLVAAGAKTVEKRSPIQLPKAKKNETEIAGMRASHVRDGVAVVRFLRWLEETLGAGEAVTEVGAADRLEAFRAEGERFRGLSFETISAFGPNGAIVHYRPHGVTPIVPGPGAIYLVDSGGQYLDGTTDITRTIALGEPTDEQRACFTHVLAGHIALGMAVFPKGTTGKHLDILARQSLWNAGLDYGHGTGHGVGCFLNVHEGPQGISPKARDVPLELGMIISNEPGYYRADAWGIRTESLVLVVEKEGFGEADRTFYELETITMCPIDQRLIAPDLLRSAERRWLDAYHATVRETLTPLLADAKDREWLAKATEPLQG